MRVRSKTDCLRIAFTAWKVLPELFCDEGDEWMEQTESDFSDFIEDLVYLLGFC